MRELEDALEGEELGGVVRAQGHRGDARDGQDRGENLAGRSVSYYWSAQVRCRCGR